MKAGHVTLQAFNQSKQLVHEVLVVPASPQGNRTARAVRVGRRQQRAGAFDAGRALARDIDQLELDPSITRYHLIGHSHGGNVILNALRGDGDANALANSPSGDPVIVTVTAALRSGGMEMAQGSGGGPGFLAAGSETPAIHVQVNRDWTQYAHVCVSVESVTFNAERNYSNNDLDQDVATTPQAGSNAFDTGYCQKQR